MSNEINFLSIEGLIASGKSTFISILRNSCIAEKYAIFIIEEPIQKCMNFSGENLLHAFYNDPKKHAFQFQLLMLLARLKAYQECINSIKVLDKPILLISERSVYSDIHVFSQLYHDKGYISETDFNLLKFALQTSNKPHLDGVIFINTRYSTMQHRINSRGRTGENHVTAVHQKNIHDCYKKLMRDLTCPSITVTTDSMFLQPASPASVRSIIECVDVFLTNIIKFKKFPPLILNLEVFERKSLDDFTDDESDGEDEKPHKLTIIKYLRKFI